jgi:predicted alpha/beta superfamily hydrolase
MSTAPTPSTLVRSERFTLDSKHVGDSFEIQVALPLTLPGLPLPERFHVVYLLDANISFGTATETARNLVMDLIAPVEPLIVVGIGYPVGEELLRHSLLRCRDLTPPGTVAPPELELYYGEAPPMGGADRFLRFLEDELDPYVRGHYPCLDAHAGLVGISYGGLFALYALFSRTRLFDRYVIGSPGIIAEHDPIWEVERACRAQSDRLDARIRLTLGELEETRPSMYNSLAANYRRLVALLEERDYAGLDWSAHVLDGETHMSAANRTITRGLAELWPLAGGLPLPEPASSQA